MLGFQRVSPGAALVDREIVNDWLHGKWQGGLQLAFGTGHDFLQRILCPGLRIGCEDKTHAPAGHAAQHPETPEVLAELLRGPRNEGLRVKIGGPGNDCLDWTLKISGRGRANDANITSAQCA